MTTEKITYEADGLRMIGDLYLPEDTSKARPGILVFPEGTGINDHSRERAQRLANLGYIALACDLHGEAYSGDFSEIMKLLSPLRSAPEHTRARAHGGYEVLRTRPEVAPTKIAAIGFCFGGTMSLELARSGADIAGVVGFHSGLATTRPEDAKNIQGKVLVCIGADDPAVPADQRTAFEAEMRAGGVDWQMHLYGGVVHSFTNPAANSRNMPDRVRYDAKADARSWASMLAFFDEIFA